MFLFHLSFVIFIFFGAEKFALRLNLRFVFPAVG